MHLDPAGQRQNGISGHGACAWSTVTRLLSPRKMLSFHLMSAELSRLEGLKSGFSFPANMASIMIGFG